MIGYYIGMFVVGGGTLGLAWLIGREYGAWADLRERWRKAGLLFDRWFAWK